MLATSSSISVYHTSLESASCSIPSKSTASSTAPSSSTPSSSTSLVRYVCVRTLPTSIGTHVPTSIEFASSTTRSSPISCVVCRFWYVARSCSMATRSAHSRRKPVLCIRGTLMEQGAVVGRSNQRGSVGGRQRVVLPRLERRHCKAGFSPQSDMTIA
jgi:hypothetical protein